MDSKDLLLADLEYIRGSLWKNEDVGEKRFGFFVTLVTAAVAGLVALSTKNTSVFPEIAKWAFGGLLAFGVLTYFRMLHRNAVTDGFKTMSDDIWNTALDLLPELKAKSYRLNWPPKKRLSKWARGGYVPTIGLINGALFGVFVNFALTDDTRIVFLAGGALAAFSWIPSVMRK
jgi:hypothetical protein